MSDLEQAVETVVRQCLGVQGGEEVVIVADRSTESIGAALHAAVARSGAEPVMTVMEPRAVDGQEPPATVAAALAAATVGVCQRLLHVPAEHAAEPALAR
jgi:leucyl aminopeptidase (aminopeptidase T)